MPQTDPIRARRGRPSRRVLATCEAAARFRFYALLRGLADICDAVESPSVILVNERKALKQCHVSCNMKSIMSRVAESTEQAVRKHLAGITLAQLVRKVIGVPRACPGLFCDDPRHLTVSTIEQ
jgi:hypothetical protein